MALSSQESNRRPLAPSHPVLSETRARQGRWGRHVLWVLLISTLLGFAGLGAAWLFRADDLAAVGKDERSSPPGVRSTDAPIPPPPTPGDR